MYLKWRKGQNTYSITDWLPWEIDLEGSETGMQEVSWGMLSGTPPRKVM